MSLTLATIKDLRHAVINAIKDARISGIEDNVFEARRENFWPEESMLAVVYTDSMKFEDKRTSPKEYVVSVNVVVDVVCQEDSDSVNDDLDNATAAVIAVLQPPMPAVGFFGGLTKRFVVVSVENNLSEVGEMNRGLQRITFETMFGVPLPIGGPADLFCKANSSIVMGRGDGNKMDFVTVVQQPPSPPPDLIVPDDGDDAEQGGNQEITD